MATTQLLLLLLLNYGLVLSCRVISAEQSSHTRVISSDHSSHGHHHHDVTNAAANYTENASFSPEISRTRPRGGKAAHDGMSYVYYVSSCPRAYDIVRERMQLYIQQDPSNAAGILRLFFHDCFVQGCDASLLLRGEQAASANSNSLRASSFRIIDEIKASLEVACPGVVSCADTLAIAARDAVFMVGGPWIPIMTGRKDSLASAPNETVAANIPLPTQGFAPLKQLFNSKGLDVPDLVALSGSHTIGQTHCHVVAQTLQLQAPPGGTGAPGDLSPPFAANLSRVCQISTNLINDDVRPGIHRVRGPPAAGGHMTVHLDGLSPNAFDNAYFKNVLLKRAIFHSDAALLQDPRALSFVRAFAANQSQFFAQFGASFVKMSQLGVLTGRHVPASAQVRFTCSSPN